jgi:hypothetical protein
MLLGGQLTIESHLGAGTCLTAELGIADKMNAPSQVESLPISHE